jgi:hypothetical protein
MSSPKIASTLRQVLGTKQNGPSGPKTPWDVLGSIKFLLFLNKENSDLFGLPPRRLLVIRRGVRIRDVIVNLAIVCEQQEA